MAKVKANETKTNSSANSSGSSNKKKAGGTKKTKSSNAEVINTEGNLDPTALDETTKEKTKKTTSSKKKSKLDESVIPNIRDTVSSILDKSYNIKTKDWREEVTEKTVKSIKVSAVCTNDRFTNEYTIFMYVRDLAKKNKYAVYDFGMDDKGYHFELIGPFE